MRPTLARYHALSAASIIVGVHHVPRSRCPLVVVTARDESIDRLFDDGALSQRSPRLDVAETDGQYTVSIDLPGVAKDDVKITIDGRRVDVSAQSQARADEEGRRARDLP